MSKQPKSRDWSQPIDSPYSEHAGSVQFKPFTGKSFTQWRKMNAEFAGVKPNEDNVIVITEGGKFAKSCFMIHWGYVLEFVDLSGLENVSKEALEDKSGESAPYQLLKWLIPLTVDEYLLDKLDLKNY